MALSLFAVALFIVNFRLLSVPASLQKSHALISRSISSFPNGSTGASFGTLGRGTFFIGLGMSNSRLAHVK
jgi:hypothetical protein